MPVTMGWYNNVLAVDPRDPERVWAAGVDWFRSDDGGRSWGLASWGGSGVPSYAHVDQHGIAFHPQYNGDDNQIALIGNDGGIYRTSNAQGRDLERRARAPAPGGAPIQVAWTSLNRGYGVTQFYHGTPFPDGTQYLAGAQDNGTIFGSDAFGPDGWRPVFGGDGGFSAVHPTQTSTWLMEFQWASLGRTTNGGNTVTTQRTGLDPIVSSMLGPDGNYLFIVPFTHDRVSNGSGSVATSSIRAPASARRGTRSVNSQDARRRPHQRHCGLADAATATVMAGTDRGHIVPHDECHAGAGVDRLHRHAAARWLGDVDRLRSAQPAAVYATYGNFGGAHVFRSIDGGATWQSIDGSGATGDARHPGALDRRRSG